MEQNYVIATASTCDLTREYLEEHNIPFISYSYVMDGKDYEDDCRESTRSETYKRMREGTVLSTSAINMYTYREFFEGLIEGGAENIVFLDMTRPLSSSYRYCEEAIEDLKEDYPDCRIVNVDTRCVSGGLGLLVKNVCKLYESGATMDYVLSWIEDNKLKIAHRFTVDDLNWLKRGGRVSNASALVGTLLSIKPVLYVPDDGTLVAASKVRGRKAALSTITDSIKNDLKDRSSSEKIEFLINHADCLEDAESVRDRILEMFPNADISISGLGVVIGAHCGPGLFTVFYMTDERRP
ncbi:MAG: DegV family protein [Lachnospiraceae bacterium]|nr:DegV family protein [Lachnospiraceae bacterium]